MNKILVINSGSATLKFKVFSIPEYREEVSGIVERIGITGSFLSVKNKNKKDLIKFSSGIKSHKKALEEVLNYLEDILPEIKLVGHRVVHGGGDFNEPVKLNIGVINKLEKYNKLAPLHNPINLICARESLRLIPKAQQFAVFDTAYYSTIPDYAHRYALPEKFYKLGIRRYGFHGISHKYAAQESAKKHKKGLNKLKIITCHLGSGCSITGTYNGKAIDTTMGFTPLEGLTMSTRAGDMDASIPLYLIDHFKMSVKEVDDLFNKRSGLLGVSGTMDMREILLASGKKVVGYKVKKKFSKDQKIKSKLALNMFVYDIVRYIGQFIAIMGGVDLVVFTGGIGERSPVVRSMVLKQINGLGKFRTIVIPANEELMIAKEISVR